MRFKLSKQYKRDSTVKIALIKPFVRVRVENGVARTKQGNNIVKSVL